MVKFEVITVCPLHSTSICFNIVDARNDYEAYGKIIGEKAICTHKPAHRFVIHKENIIGWQPVAPIKHMGRPPAYVPPVPSEKVYYVEPEQGEKRMKRTEWWK